MRSSLALTSKAISTSIGTTISSSDYGQYQQYLTGYSAPRSLPLARLRNGMVIFIEEMGEVDDAATDAGVGQYIRLAALVNTLRECKERYKKRPNVYRRETIRILSEYVGNDEVSKLLGY